MSVMHVTPAWGAIVRELGLDDQTLFTDPRIRVWRSIRERENCTLDATLRDGRRVRLHIKRHHRSSRAAETEARALELLQRAGIPTTPLVAFGHDQSRSVIVTADLADHRDSEQLVRDGLPFESLLISTADLAARLHGARLHHRDLYLCHFFAKSGDQRVEIALIDAARVKVLPRWLLRRRWIVKDLAQFWYSTLSLPVTDEQRRRWLERYCTQAGVADAHRLQRAIERKSQWIAEHDRKLRLAQPNRNVSIPEASA